MYDPQISTHLLVWSRACVYQIWSKSIHPNSSYHANKGVDKPFLRPPLYEKNSRKIKKICTTPKFELILCYGLKHVCIKFGENPCTQTRVIVLTSVFTFLTFVTLTFDLGSQKIAEDTSFLIPFHMVKLQNPTQIR